ncbi:MAG: S9 family peptidase [Acidobacteria bacterium]|nr:S9 family peptidase [Acidobacteriota bacterium]MCA1637064.1 S9 family peptidase [Acidobacteriota bacterium]
MKKFFFLFALFVFCLPTLAQNYTIQQYLNIRSASSPALSPDGKRLAYLTNVTGTSQIWVIDLPGSAPKQMTNYDDNVSFVRWSPDGKGLVFGKARGGDENAQFFWIAANNLQTKELTNNPKVRHNFGDFSDDGAKIYYASNKRDRNFFDVYSMDVASGKEELLYQQDGNNDFAAASKDGSRIVISRSGTELGLDNNLYLIDTKTKQATLLTPHEGAAQFEDVHFISNDEIVFGTNDKREFITPCQMDLRTKKVSICGNENWDLDAIEISKSGDTNAWTINKEGFSELYIKKMPFTKDRRSGELPAPSQVKLPAQGVVGGLNFSQDGSKLAFTFNSAKYNSDIWIYDLNSKSLTQATKSDRAGIPQESFVAPQLIKYKTFDGREIPAWFYRPNASISFNSGQAKGKFPQTKNLPVIISVHGGPEGQERPGFNPLYQYYLSRGYAILATNVRGSTGYGKTFTHLDDVRKREDSVKDLAYAVEWLKTQGGADAKRIAVMGGSYGGYMTLAAITLYPDLFAAAVNTVGITNWETFLKNTSGYRRRQREVEYGMLDKDLDFLRSISPLAKVDLIKTPLFVIHGKNDPRVPYTEAEQIVESLRKRGGKVEYKLFDDEGHGVSKLKNRLVLYPLVADFLGKYLK